MSGPPQAFGVSRSSDASTIRMTRAGLLVAGIGALVVVLNPFGIAIVGVIVGVFGAALTLPYGWGEGWCYAVVGGAFLGIVAWLISGPHQTLGGWLAVIGALAILVGAPLGYPMEEE